MTPNVLLRPGVIKGHKPNFSLLLLIITFISRPPVYVGSVIPRMVTNQFSLGLIVPFMLLYYHTNKAASTM